MHQNSFMCKTLPNISNYKGGLSLSVSGRSNSAFVQHESQFQYWTCFSISRRCCEISQISKYRLTIPSSEHGKLYTEICLVNFSGRSRLKIHASLPGNLGRSPTNLFVPFSILKFRLLQQILRKLRPKLTMETTTIDVEHNEVNPDLKAATIKKPAPTSISHGNSSERLLKWHLKILISAVSYFHIPSWSSHFVTKLNPKTRGPNLVAPHWKRKPF